MTVGVLATTSSGKAELEDDEEEARRLHEGRREDSRGARSMGCAKTVRALGLRSGDEMISQCST